MTAPALVNAQSREKRSVNLKKLVVTGARLGSYMKVKRQQELVPDTQAHDQAHSQESLVLSRGRTMRVKTCSSLAPSTRAASSNSWGRSIM